MRHPVALIVVMVLAAASAPAALGEGNQPEKLPLPATGSGGEAGISAPDGGTRYIARPMGTRTLVQRVHSGAVNAASLHGEFVVPAVTRNGLGGGLSANGTTLVLVGAGPAFPRSRTSFLVLDAKRLRIRDRVQLRGDFSFDAMSPDGSRLYLVEYTSRTDRTEYSVRAYDVRAGRLTPGAIVDPSERDASEMGGYPIARAMSPNSRWAYTLYSAPGRRPFVHALDTVDGKAHCIDLPGVRPGSLGSGRLSLDPGGTRLTVSDDKGATVAVVDTATFEATAPATDHGASVSSSSGGGLPWVMIGLGAGLAVSIASIWWTPRLHRRRLADGES
jgi:hypothetical protein